MPNTVNGFFDISSPEIFFEAIKKSIKELDESSFKSSEKLMFIVMGLCHLREWIAPGYHHEQQAQTAEQIFFSNIFKLPEYKIILSLCNSSKHLAEFSGTTTVQGNVPLDEWEDIDSVLNFDIGPALSYAVDGQDIRSIIARVVQFYEANWFAKKLE